ncbi:MAG: lysozyme [Hyphomicrobiales bacterium]
MKISNIGLDLIKRFEGLRLTAYLCPAKVWTIGYGHTHGVKEGDQITEQIAHEFLKKDVRWAQNAIEKHVTVPLDQHQFDALVSFIYNIGAGAFRTSTLLKRLNEGRYDAAADQFRRWNKVKKKVFRGLTRRRNEEAELFSDHSVDEMPQIVDAPPVKTMLNSKTNITSLIGVGGVCATQLDAAKEVLDGVNEVTAKGGDVADHLGGFLNSVSWPMVAGLGIIAVFSYVIFERKRKIDNDGI